MKRLLSMLSLVVLAVALVACNDTDKPQDPVKNFTDYADGLYFAIDEESTSYRYFVILEVEDGKLTSATWDAVVYHGSDMTKFDLSAAGQYEMHPGLDDTAHAEKLEWHEQAAAVTRSVLDNQSFDVTIGEDGKLTEDDAIAGVSIKPGAFYELADEALEAGKVAEGDYDLADGVYFGGYGDRTFTTNEDGSYNKESFEYIASMVLVNGTIVYVDLNAVHTIDANDEGKWDFATRYEGKVFADDVVGKTISKDELGLAYGMGLDFTTGEPNGKLTWSENADKVEAFILANQGLEVTYNDNRGHSDTISGVSVHVVEFEEAFNAALGIDKEIVLPE